MAEVNFRFLSGPNRGEYARNLETPISIGREFGNSIAIDDDRVSRFHATIVEEEGNLFVLDLDSTNGILVNGQRVKRKRIVFGDKITIGRSVFLLLDSDDSESTERSDTVASRSPFSERPTTSSEPKVEKTSRSAEGTYSFDSFYQVADQDAWFPVVEKLIDEAAKNNSEVLNEILEPLPRIGKYHLIAWIGQGAMAKVFAAWNWQDNCAVAIKLFEPRHEEVWSLIQRFQNEADAMERVQHEHIVSLLDRGNHRGRVYIVMNLIVGASLAALQQNWISKLSSESSGSDLEPGFNRPTAACLPLESLSADSTSTSMLAIGSEAEVFGNETDYLPAFFREIEPFSESHFSTVAEIGRDICDALRYSHSQGILHRDIKPSNLLIDHGGKVWVTDFGLANFDWQSTTVEQRLTRCGDLLGTIAYMSAKAVDGNYSQQSDLYSLGVTLCELAMLQPMWQGRNDSEILRMLFQDTHPRFLEDAPPSMPQDLKRVIRCLLEAESPASKVTAEQMYHCLDTLSKGEPVVLPRHQTGIAANSRRLFHRWFNAAQLKTLAIFWGLSVAAFVFVIGFKRYGEYQVYKTTSDNLYLSVQERMNQAVYSVEMLEQFSESVADVNRDNFRAMVEPMFRNHPEVRSVGFAQAMQTDSLKEFETTLSASKSSENDEMQFDSTASLLDEVEVGESLASATKDHVVLKFFEPEVEQAENIGVDLMEEPRLREAIKQARFSRGIAIAGPIQFVDSRDVRRSGFVLVKGIERELEPDAYAVVYYRFDKMLQALRPERTGERILVKVIPQSITTDPIYEGDQNGTPIKIQNTEPDFEYELRIENRRWKLTAARVDPWQNTSLYWLLQTLVFAVIAPIPILLVARASAWLYRKGNG